MTIALDEFTSILRSGDMYFAILRYVCLKFTIWYYWSRTPYVSRLFGTEFRRGGNIVSCPVSNPNPNGQLVLSRAEQVRRDVLLFSCSSLPCRFHVPCSVNSNNNNGDSPLLFVLSRSFFAFVVHCPLFHFRPTITASISALLGWLTAKTTLLLTPTMQTIWHGPALCLLILALTADLNMWTMLFMLSLTTAILSGEW